MRPDVISGAKFPDYELTDHTKIRRRLSELQGNDPLILILSRGHYCPKDHQQHLALAAFYPKIAVAYTKIVTISTDNILEINEFRDAVGAQWAFLSDAGRSVQKDLDIQEYTDPFHNPMIPHTFVLEPGLIIYKIYNGYWFWGPALARGSVARPPRGHSENSPRLGPRCARAPTELGRRRQVAALPIPASLRRLS